MNIVYKIELLFLKSVRRMYRALHKNPSYNHTTIADDQVSNYIKELLLNDKPCMVGRFGCTEFDATYFPYVLKQSLFNRYKFFIQGYIPTIRDNQNLKQKYVDVISFYSGFFRTAIQFHHVEESGCSGSLPVGNPDSDRRQFLMNHRHYVA